MNIPRWKVDVIVGGEVVKTLHEAANTAKAAVAKAKHKMRGSLSSAGAFTFKATKEATRHHASKRSKKLGYDTSTGEGQKRLMQESVGMSYAEPRALNLAPGDYGHDPIGPDSEGVFRWRMVPSGDIVDKAELDRRMKKRHHSSKKSASGKRTKKPRLVDVVCKDPTGYRWLRTNARGARPTPEGPFAVTDEAQWSQELQAAGAKEIPA